MMDFKTTLHIKPWQTKIRHNEAIMLVGSCFTEHMTGFLKRHKFTVLENPHGILFNPISIANAISRYALGELYKKDDLFKHGEFWHSWDHHGKFSGLDAEECLTAINSSLKNAEKFIARCEWVIVTLGSAWAYELLPTAPNYQPDTICANCHKIPASAFQHRLLQVNEVVTALREIVQVVQGVNARAQIIFTISPVRHFREGLIENNRSKSVLHLAIHQLLQEMAGCHYFPSYELVIDDLRDYRFYAEDMVHPNYLATRYVWDKFREACISPDDYSVMDEAFKVNAAISHKPIHPDSAAHQQFLNASIALAESLQKQYSYMDFEEEILQLKSALKV